MICFFTQGNGKKPLLGAITAEPCTVLGEPLLRVVCHRSGNCRAVVRALKKAGADGVAITPDLPDELKNALTDAGFAVFDGKTLMSLMLPDILRTLQKSYGFDPSAPIAVYGNPSQEVCRRAVYDAAEYSRLVCLISDAPAQSFADEVLEATGQALSLCTPKNPHMAVWCGARGEGAAVAVNLGTLPETGAVNTLILSAPDGGELHMAVAEATLGKPLTRTIIEQSGIKLKFFG